MIFVLGLILGFILGAIIGALITEKVVRQAFEEIPKEDTKRLKWTDIDRIKKLPHCTGCTDPKSEGTHQLETIEHYKEFMKKEEK